MRRSFFYLLFGFGALVCSQAEASGQEESSHQEQATVLGDHTATSPASPAANTALRLEVKLDAGLGIGGAFRSSDKASAWVLGGFADARLLFDQNNALLLGFVAFAAPIWSVCSGRGRELFALYWLVSRQSPAR